MDAEQLIKGPGPDFKVDPERVAAARKRVRALSQPTRNFNPRRAQRLANARSYLESVGG